MLNTARKKMKETNLEEIWCFPGFPVSAEKCGTEGTTPPPLARIEYSRLANFFFFYCVLAVIVPFFFPPQDC